MLKPLLPVRLHAAHHGPSNARAFTAEELAAIATKLSPTIARSRFTRAEERRSNAHGSEVLVRHRDRFPRRRPAREPRSSEAPVRAESAWRILRSACLFVLFCMNKLSGPLSLPARLLIASPQLLRRRSPISPAGTTWSRRSKSFWPGNIDVSQEAVEMTQGNMRFYADHVEYLGETNSTSLPESAASIETDHQIAADRADFNAKTRLGTFYNARGFATWCRAGCGRRSKRVRRTPTRTCSSTARRSRRTSEDTYIISKGGFTSCAQANPRWEMTSGTLGFASITTRCRNMMLKVKGVPALYLPCDVLPAQQGQPEHRLPDAELRLSTDKGQTISNAFFWAINRSQDATILHDWFSKTGQAISGEYRYVSLGGRETSAGPSQRTSIDLRARRR